MKLKDLMTPELRIIEPGSPLQEAAEEMRNWGVGALPVCESDRTVGMITDRDIVVRAIARGLDPVKTVVKDVMTDEVTSCPAGYDVQEAVRLMIEKKIRRILVEDTNGKSIGIVSLGDLALHCPNEALTEQVLEEVSHPT